MLLHQIKQAVLIFITDEILTSKQAFSKYLNDVNLDDRQIYFVNQIINYIVQNGMMKDFSVMQESPFTDKGDVGDVFTDSQNFSSDF